MLSNNALIILSTNIILKTRSLTIWYYLQKKIVPMININQHLKLLLYHIDTSCVDDTILQVQ